MKKALQTLVAEIVLNNIFPYFYTWNGYVLSIFIPLNDIMHMFILTT